MHFSAFLISLIFLQVISPNNRKRTANKDIELLSLKDEIDDVALSQSNPKRTRYNEDESTSSNENLSANIYPPRYMKRKKDPNESQSSDYESSGEELISPLNPKRFKYHESGFHIIFLESSSSDYEASDEHSDIEIEKISQRIRQSKKEHHDAYKISELIQKHQKKYKQMTDEEITDAINRVWSQPKSLYDLLVVNVIDPSGILHGLKYKYNGFSLIKKTLRDFTNYQNSCANGNGRKYEEIIKKVYETFENIISAYEGKLILRNLIHMEINDCLKIKKIKDQESCLQLMIAIDKYGIKFIAQIMMERKTYY